MHDAPTASGCVEQIVPAACVNPVPVTLMLVSLSDLPDWFFLDLADLPAAEHVECA